jgi:hypothetical protein
MSDELGLLTGSLAGLLDSAETVQLRALAIRLRALENELRALAQNVQDPQVDLQTWQGLAAEYHQIVVTTIKEVIPKPLRALPGMDELVDRLLNGALDEAGQALSIGLAEAGITMPAVYLPRPPTLPPGPPELLGRLPPTGITLAFGAGPAGGSGSLDYQSTPNQRLSGRFGLKLTIASVTTLAILEESSGTFSLFSLLSARFTPGLQLGFGFAISGIGGLIGINRGVDTGALEGQFRSGALTHALFGDDPIRDATSVLATLGAVFRARRGAQVFGPTLQLSWLKIGVGDLFTADIGVFMQLPGPSRIDILGSIRSAIPPVFRLQLDLHGEIDLANELIGFHAVIVDSHIMGIFRITGEAIFRWRFGRDPYVVLTIGGFFPGFNPAPAQLPADIQRVGFVLDLPVSLPMSLRAEGYLAVTSNTFQFGILLEAGIDAGAFGAQGHIQLDAMLQFSPFYFEADFSAGFRVQLLGKTLHGVRCSGQISGPGPVVIRAEITYETPFFLPDISWRDTFVFGDPAPRQEARIHSVVDELALEMKAAHNLRAENGADPSVALRDQPSNDIPRLSPLGSLVWSQRRLPLGMRLEQVQNIPLETAQTAVVTVESIWQEDQKNPPQEGFNLAQYIALSDAQKLNMTGCYEEQPAGVRLDQGLFYAGETAHPAAYDDIYRPNPEPKSGLFFALSKFVLLKAGARTAPAVVANLKPRVTLKAEEWHSGANTFTTQSAAQSAARALGRPAFLAGDVVDGSGI